MTSKKTFQRLPTCVEPLLYDILLKPNLETFHFNGTVDIKIQVNESTDKIILNSADLKILSVNLKLAKETKVEPKFVLNEIDETLTLHFEAKQATGIAILSIEFEGELNDKMKGFYRSSHMNALGEKTYCAVTQFCPTDARRCFPCWDEPAIKSVFEVTVVAPNDKVVLSNMPVVYSRPTGLQVENQKTVKFAPSPIMSTYLMAVVVGDFDYVEDTSSDGVLVRVYTPPGVQSQGRFALHVATKVLPYYKEYFNVAYPLPKLDLIAIGDFAAGAMENWGLITYRQTILLVDEQNTSSAIKQQVALTVGHELAHQWFGNLVTMEWWTDLWLNEGYASFVENLCVDYLFPEYNIWKQFLSCKYKRALELDCLQSSHPIEVTVGHPSEVDEIFDEISYCKGASVIRMLYEYIGEADFRKGMNIYLTRHQYGTTFTKDLWAALEESSGKPVGEVMSTWTKQVGFPVLKILSRQVENDTRQISISQERFYLERGVKRSSSLWMVPLTVKTSSSDHSFMLCKESDTMEISAKEGDWIKVNPGCVGVFRTLYDQNILYTNLPSIEDQTIPDVDRLGILDDLLTLAQAGSCDTVQVFKVLSVMKNEDSYPVWNIIASALSKIRILLSNAETDLIESYNKFARGILKPISERIGWESKADEGHLDKMLRSLIFTMLVKFEDTDIIEESKKRLKAHVNKENILPADLRVPVYGAVLSTGDISTFNAMIELYRKETLQEERDRMARSLGSVKENRLLSKALEFAMSDEVRDQDKAFVILSIAQGKVGRELVWEYFKDNWTTFTDKYKGGFIIKKLVKLTLENFTSYDKADEIEAFYKNKDKSSFERSLSQALEGIRINAAWFESDIDKIRNYFKGL